MYIDIHAHCRVFPAPYRNGAPGYALPEELLAKYDALGVEKAVLLPEVNPEYSLGPQSNQEVIFLACRKYPDRFIPFCNIDPRIGTNSPNSQLGEIIEFYKDLGCKGIGEVCANLPFDHPLVENLFKHVEKAGLPLIFHMSTTLDGGDYGLYDDPGLPRFEKTLQKFPNLIFLGHSQPFWAEISAMEDAGGRGGYPKGLIKKEGRLPELLRRYPNLHCDLSAGSGYNAISRDPEYGPKFLEEFQDKLYFGTDICAPDTPAPQAEFLLKLRNEKRISETCFQKIAKKNAIRLLNL